MLSYFIKVEYVREGSPNVFIGTFLGHNPAEAIMVARTFVRTYLKTECINMAAIMNSAEY